MTPSADFAALWLCVDKRWSPVIGDPSAMGWITVAAYGVAALLCLAAARRPGSGLRGFWGGLCLLLVLLAVNKQLDLQSALTATGRCISQLQGWYAERRAVQREFILALLMVSGAVTLLLFWLMRRRLGSVWLALLGVCSLMSFIAVRAIGFHHFDALINMRIDNIRMNWVLELGGIAMIGVNAAAMAAGRPMAKPGPRGRRFS